MVLIKNIFNNRNNWSIWCRWSKYSTNEETCSENEGLYEWIKENTWQINIPISDISKGNKINFIINLITSNPLNRVVSLREGQKESDYRIDTYPPESRFFDFEYSYEINVE